MAMVMERESLQRLYIKVIVRCGWYVVCTAMSLAHLKLRISERFRKAKVDWHSPPDHHGTMEIPPPPPKKSCLDGARNAIARTAAQIRSGHWRSAVYLKMIRKRADDESWFCKRSVGMTRSHTFLRCPSEKLVLARTEAWEGKNPGGVRVLLANPDGRGGLSVS